MAPAPPTSPQKRVTRARAAAKKAIEDSGEAIPQMASKPTTRRKVGVTQTKPIEADIPEGTESLRKSARRVATAATAAPARRIKVTPTTGTVNPEQLPQHEDDVSRLATSQPRATRSKRSTGEKASVEESKTEEQAPKPKRRVINEAKDVSTIRAPKLRGRPKKVENDRDTMVVENLEASKESRARTVSSVTNTRALAVAPSRTAPPRKKVTFQDITESDKENQPIVKAKANTKSKPAAPASGIRAKPIRRPAATTKTQAKEKATDSTGEATSQAVLTPKKVRQVAKSSSPADSEDDELNGAKTPIRDLSQSPRRNADIARTLSPVKKLDFVAAALAASPLKSQPVTALLSPARRPPPSPFKDALKESPKRGDFFSNISQLSTLKQEDGAGKLASSATSTLLQSPKRVVLDSSIFPQSSSKPKGTNFKASLLQSPPKRPVSPVKASSVVEVKANRAILVPQADVEMMSPDVTVSSQFKSTQSPDRSCRVHKMTAQELAEDVKSTLDFDESIVDIRSPLKLDNEKLDSFKDTDGDCRVNGLADDDLKEEHQAAKIVAHHKLSDGASLSPPELPVPQVLAEIEDLTTAPTSIMLRHETSVNPASFLFRSSRLRDDDESSEDELQSPIRTFPSQTPTTSRRKESSLSTAHRAVFSQSSAFTPLAAQLSGWLASSPDKQPVKKYQQRGIFSPVAAQHVPGEIIVDRRSPATSRVSMEPDHSATHRQSLGSRKSIGSRHSLAYSMNQSPDKSTYFADEMAVKDLEEEIENMQAEAQEHDEEGKIDIVEDMHAERLLADEIAERIDSVEAEKEDGQNQDDEPKVEVNMLSEATDHSCDLPIDREAGTVGEAAERHQLPDTSQEFTLSSAYEDETEIPTPAADLERTLASFQQNAAGTQDLGPSIARHPLTEFVTPSRPQAVISRLANTVVSKVPLRAEGNVSAIKVSKKRSRSLSVGPSSVKKTPLLHTSDFPRSTTIHTFSPAHSQADYPCSTATTPGQQSFAIDDFRDSTLDGIEIDERDENLPPFTPTAASLSHLPVTSADTTKIAMPAAPSGVLQGAVVFVDVHTTEGADASGIFIELLTQMGAKCVKSWSWNPRASMGANVGDSSVATLGSGKIGITHVVYKDGGKRTLEKVRDTEGVVRCVGVGWVLDCEREDKWLDESAFAVDISILPRGGSRRRKSMEPRALLNMNGNLAHASAPRRSFSAEMARQMRDELIKTPLRGQPSSSFDPVDHHHEDEGDVEVRDAASEESGFSTPTSLSIPNADSPTAAPATPTGFVNYDPSAAHCQTPGADGAAAYSPTTPYYLSQGAKLIQMTCPPKQTNQGLFAREDGDGEGRRGDVGDGKGGRQQGSGGRGNAGLGLGLGLEVGFPISGKLGDVPDEAVRRRLADTRRRTMGWRPRVGSPLGR